MAEADAQVQETVSTSASLKYLGFLPVAILKVTTYIAAFYEFAKDSSGPLKPSVDSVEGTVKTVVGPVCQKIEGKPLELLVFIDRKLDDIFHFVDGVLPPTVKEASSKAYGAIISTVAEVQKDGICSTTRSYVDKYEPVVESYGIKAYKKAITFPLVPQAVVVTRYGAVKINQIIVSLKENGLPLASYLPMLPVSYFDKITKSE